jgi:hypothetical protein
MAPHLDAAAATGCKPSVTPGGLLAQPGVVRPQLLLAAGGQCAAECGFMAQLLITDDVVTIDLSLKEKIQAAHGNQTFLRSAVTGVRTVPDCIAEVHGIKGPGTGFVASGRGAGTTAGASLSRSATGTARGLSSN